MPKRRRPPVQLPSPAGTAGDAPIGVARPPGEAPAWRILRGVLAAVTWVALATLIATGIWLWLEYLPPWTGVSKPPQQMEVELAQDVHMGATWVLGFGTALWLAAIAATSATSRRIVATGALLALVGGGVAAWTGLLLPWDQVVGGDSGDAGLLLGDAVATYVVDGAERSAGTMEALAWGHVLAAIVVLVGIGAAAGLARARRRRPDDDAMPAHRVRRDGPSRLTLPGDVDAPPGWRSTGGTGTPGSGGPSGGDPP